MNICNKLNNRDLNQKQSTQMFDLLMKSNLNTLFNIIYTKFKSCFQECKHIINENDLIIKNHIQLVRDEIFIKIESMKIELDNLYEMFTKELDKI